jgi:ankyrin repeat protein
MMQNLFKSVSASVFAIIATLAVFAIVINFLFPSSEVVETAKSIRSHKNKRLIHYLKSGHDVNAELIENGNGRQKRTLLHEAVQRRNYEAVQILLQAGASVDSMNFEGETPLITYFTALDPPRSINLLILLLKKSNVNFKISDGNSVVHYAAMYGSMEELRCLKNAGADFSVLNSKGISAYDIATEKGWICCMNKLF